MLDETRRNLEAKARRGIDALHELLEANLFHIVQPTTTSVLAAAKTIELKDAAIAAGALAAGDGSPDTVIAWLRREIPTWVSDAVPFALHMAC